MLNSKRDHEELIRIKKHQTEVKLILEAHEESSQVRLQKLTAFSETLEAQLKACEVTGNVEKFYIEQLSSFVLDRGAALFQYGDIKNANNTNNIKKQNLKR